VGAARERLMDTVFDAVSLVVLGHAASERLDLVVESPFLLVDERLYVDRRSFQFVVLQRDLILAAL